MRSARAGLPRNHLTPGLFDKFYLQALQSWNQGRQPFELNHGLRMQTRCERAIIDGHAVLFTDARMVDDPFEIGRIIKDLAEVAGFFMRLGDSDIRRNAKLEAGIYPIGNLEKMAFSYAIRVTLGFSSLLKNVFEGCLCTTLIQCTPQTSIINS